MCYLVALGIVLSFMTQSVFDALHNGLEFFNFSKLSIFVGSIVVAILMVIFTYIFLGIMEEKKQAT